MVSIGIAAHHEVMALFKKSPHQEFSSVNSYWTPPVKELVDAGRLEIIKTTRREEDEVWTLAIAAGKASDLPTDPQADDPCSCPGCQGKLIVEYDRANAVNPGDANHESWLECWDCDWRPGDPIPGQKPVPAPRPTIEGTW